MWQISCPYESGWSHQERDSLNPSPLISLMLGYIYLSNPYLSSQVSTTEVLMCLGIWPFTFAFQNCQAYDVQKVPGSCPWKPVSLACPLLMEGIRHNRLEQMLRSEYCSHVLEPHHIGTFINGNPCVKPPEHQSSPSPAVNMPRTHKHTAAYGWVQLSNSKSRS